MTSSSLAGGDDWATFAHDIRRTGSESLPVGVTQKNVSQLHLRWSFQSSAGFQASPIVVNGVVYVVDTKGVLTALRATDGSIIWQKQVPTQNGDVSMTPALFDGILFIGPRGFTTDSSTTSGKRAGPSTLFAIDPVSGSTEWTAQIPGLLHSAPVVINGLVYVGSSGGDSSVGCVPGGILVFNERTGTPEASWLVGSDPAEGGSVWSPLSTDGSHIYYGSGNTCVASPYNDAIISASPALALQWAQQTDSNLFDDDDVGGGVMLANGTGYVMTKEGFLDSVNLTTGGVNWAFTTNAPKAYGGFSTPTMTESTIVVGGGYGEWTASGTLEGGRVFGISLSGKQEWEIDTNDAALWSPASTSDLVFVELDNTFDALDPTSGKVLWSYPTVGGFKASPAIGPSGIFAADLSGIVYAFGTASPNAPAPQTARRASHIMPSIPKMCLTGRSDGIL